MAKTINVLMFFILAFLVGCGNKSEKREYWFNVLERQANVLETKQPKTGITVSGLDIDVAYFRGQMLVWAQNNKSAWDEYYAYLNTIKFPKDKDLQALHEVVLMGTRARRDYAQAEIDLCEAVQNVSRYGGLDRLMRINECKERVEECNSALYGTGALLGSALVKVYTKEDVAQYAKEKNIVKQQAQNNQRENGLASKPGGILLRIIDAKASSCLPETRTNKYFLYLAYDGNKSTAWQENSGKGGIGEWIEFKFDKEYLLKKIVLINGYSKFSQSGIDRFPQNSRVKKAAFHFSNGSVQGFDLLDQREPQVAIINPVRTASVRIEIIDYYPGSKWKDNGISEISFYSEK